MKKSLKEFSRRFARRPELRRGLYREVPLEEMRERLARFQRLLGDPDPLEVERLAKHVFRVSA